MSRPISELRPTERFSNRVEDYVKFRPGYPPEVLDFLHEELGLKPEHSVADIGCGTGISSELFLRNGNEVHGIEPNAKMREAGQTKLLKYAKFYSLQGCAEATGLPDSSVDWVVAFQAFHWFDPEAARREFRRILKPNGSLALIWNDRDEHRSEFSRGYERILLGLEDYRKTRHRTLKSGSIQKFLDSDSQVTFSYHQDLDFASLLGRTSSSSYVPEASDPRFAKIRESLRDLFERCQQGGKIRMEYNTIIHYARW